MNKFLALILFIPAMAFASKGGGGGLVVACYRGEELVSVELLDIYEARAKGVELKILQAELNQDIEELSFKATKNDEAEVFIEGVKNIFDKFKFIPTDAELEPTNDAFPVFLPRGCKTKQVANYYNDQLIWLDSILFNKMDYRNQLALAFHEYIYSRERMYEIDDSRYTRAIIGNLFAKEDVFNPSKFKESTWICYSQLAKTKFYAHQVGNPENNQWLFDFKIIKGHRIYSKKFALVNLAENSPLNPETNQGEDSTIQPYQYSSVILDSQINGGESFEVSSGLHHLSIRWKGFDPGDNFSESEVMCIEKNLGWETGD